MKRASWTSTATPVVQTASGFWHVGHVGHCGHGAGSSHAGHEISGHSGQVGQSGTAATAGVATSSAAGNVFDDEHADRTTDNKMKIVLKSMSPSSGRYPRRGARVMFPVQAG
jgi:hypothetical protein